MAFFITLFFLPCFISLEFVQGSLSKWRIFYESKLASLRLLQYICALYSKCIYSIWYPVHPYLKPLPYVQCILWVCIYAIEIWTHRGRDSFVTEFDLHRMSSYIQSLAHLDDYVCKITFHACKMNS